MLRGNPSFRRLLAARAVSFIGDGAALIALILYVKGTLDSGPAVASVLLAMSLPRILGPLAGAVADRFDHRTIMIACDLGQAALFGLIALTLPPLPVLVALIAATSLLTTAFLPASLSALPGLVPGPHLPAANALMGSALNLHVAVGPVVGGALVAWIGVRGALAVNALTFVVSALLLVGLPRRSAADRPAGRLLADAREGFRFAMRHAVARAVLMTLFIGLIFGALTNVAQVFLARDELGASAIGFGVLEASWGIGMLASSVALLRFGMVLSPRAIFLGGWMLTGVALVATGRAPTLAVAVAFETLGGAGNGADNVTSDTLIQTTVPARMLGRVFGMRGSAAFVSSGIAYAIGGPLLEVLSARTVFVIAGCGVVAVGVLSFVLMPRNAGEEVLDPG